jgi:hypothetical protein
MALAFALLLPVVALIVDEGATYTLVRWVCATGATGALAVLPLVTLGMTVAGAVIGSAAMLSYRASTSPPYQSRLIVATLAVGMNVLCGLVIVAAIFPRQMLGPCE